MKGRLPLKINIDDEAKTATFWLTNAEQSDGALADALRPQFQALQQKKYTVAVFHSGGQDLLPLTASLIAHNRTLDTHRDAR